MRKRIYDTNTQVRYLLANWPEKEVTYKQLRTYGNYINLDLTSKAISSAIHDFKHIGLVTTKQLSGTVLITINAELRALKFSEDLGLAIPNAELVAKIPKYKSVDQRKLIQPPAPKKTYSFVTRCIIATFNREIQFSWKDIRRELDKRDIKAGGKHDQVKPYLNKLMKEGLLIRTKKGQPSLYQLPQEFFDYFRPEKNSMIATFPEYTTHFENNFMENARQEAAVKDPEAKPEPEIETEAKPDSEEDGLPANMTPADFGAAMFDYMLELRNGNGVEEVQRLRAKLEDSQMKVHNLYLEIAKQNKTIQKLNDTKSRHEETIKELTSAVTAARNEIAMTKNQKRTFSMRDVVTIKGRKPSKDKAPTKGVAFNFST
jgi:uncharacterized coiled-coil protein SlyX